MAVTANISQWKVTEVKPFIRQMRSRMPFRFGNTVMTGMPVLHLRVRLEDAAGHSCTGASACGLVSMWFDKDYTKSETRRELDLKYSVARAIESYLHATPASPFRLHHQVESQVRPQLASEGLNGLVAGYGIALMDAAIMDAVCRQAGLNFFHALKAGLFGLDYNLEPCLPDQPVSLMAVRHTVGLGDPLTAAEVSTPINDGLPETLEQVIAGYGVRYFKVKVNNDIAASIDRLKNISALLQRNHVDYRLTLDGNESFATMEEFLPFVREVMDCPELAELWKRTLWIEQPVARTKALDPGVAASLKTISREKPVIIDESDDHDTALTEAMALGYAGISAKNCKGVYRTLKSFYDIAVHGSGILSSEDLTNQPVLPNHQDLCLAAALGIPHSERNGHHFFRGFEFFSSPERAAALREYPSLYCPGKDGVPSLAIRDGNLDMQEINSAIGFGVASEPDWARLEPLDLPQSVPAVS